MFDANMLYGLALTAVPILLSLSVHEMAHARTALAFGDPTAKMMGRCTLNPLAHLDPLGTLMMVRVGFGWAKPVPVNPANLDPPRLGNVAVSAAGPLSNLAIAFLCGMALRAMTAAGVTVDIEANFVPMDIAVFLLTYTLLVNLTLCLFNLIPLFPLDGHHIGRETLSAARRQEYMYLQMRYGQWVLFALLFGPRLLYDFTKIHFDPMGWYLGFAEGTLIDPLVGNAAHLVGCALFKFRGYTPL
jgi:Zn-dependent protease